MANLDLYEAVRSVPENALKSINAGRLKGKSDINPMWRLKNLTEQFGPCGIGWKYIITKQWLEQGSNGEIAAFCNIDLYYKMNGEWSEAVPGTGGSSFVANETKGPYTSDECYKMALTDAISVACKALGFAADVYWSDGRTKYTAKSEEPSKQEPPKYASSKHTPQKPDSDKAFTKPTTEMLKALNALAQRKGIDLSMHGVGWTGKAASKYWTMQDYLKVKAELEKVVDKHEQGDPDGQANKGSGAKIYGK